MNDYDNSEAQKPRLRTVADAFHIDRREAYYQVEFRDRAGNLRKIGIPREQFQVPSQVARTLVRVDADLPDDQKAAVAIIKAAIDERNGKLIEITSRSGWHDDSFVYFDQTFGSLRGKLFHEGASHIDPALGLQQGTVEAWREGMRGPCEHSDFLLFALGVSASGPLIPLIGDHEGTMFHYHGTEPEAEDSSAGYKTKSTSGKTTAGRAAASLIGRCRKTDLMSFAMTERSVEDYCAAHTHLVAVFDEEGRGMTTGGRLISPDQLPYVVTSGRGTLRSRKAIQDPDLQNLTWCLPALSTGENPLDSPGRKKPRPEGAQVRMIPIPVPPGRNRGIFNRLVGPRHAVLNRCSDLARQIDRVITTNYGVVMPSYLERLVPQRERIADRLPYAVERFVRHVGANVDPWEIRFARGFGLALAGAHLLSKFGIAPWTRERAEEAVVEIYKRARSSSVSEKDAANRVINRLKALVREEEHFPVVEKGQSVPADHAERSWGLIRTLDDHGRVIAVDLRHLRRLITPQAILELGLRQLRGEQVVLPGEDGKITRQLMVGSERRRYVVFILKALTERA